MEMYANLGGESGIIQYSIGDDYIDVMFSTGAVYRYSYASAGSIIVDEMKRLAKRGYGLNSYIMRNARKSYEKR